MSTYDQANVEKGLLGESLAAAAMRGLGWSLLDVSQDQGQKRLLCNQHLRFTLPDFLAFSGGRPFWVEVKTRSRPWNEGFRNTWGIDENAWRSSHRAQDATGLPVWLAVVFTKPNMVYMATLQQWEPGSTVALETICGQRKEHRRLSVDNASRIISLPRAQLDLELP